MQHCSTLLDHGPDAVTDITNVFSVYKVVGISRSSIAYILTPHTVSVELESHPNGRHGRIQNVRAKKHTY